MTSPTSYCLCNDSDVKPHVHCQCKICSNAPVSKATAYRHFNRSNLLLTQADTGSGARNNDNFLNDAASFERSSPNSGYDVGEQEIDELVSFGASGEGSILSGSPVQCNVAIDHEPIERTESSSEPEAEMVEITSSGVDDVISEKNYQSNS